MSVHIPTEVATQLVGNAHRFKLESGEISSQIKILGYLNLRFLNLQLSVEALFNVIRKAAASRTNNLAFSFIF